MTVDTEQLSRDLDAALATLGELGDLLEHERSLLATRAADELPAAAERKHGLLERLERLNPVGRSGATAAAIEAELERRGDDATLSRWRRFLDALGRVRRDNERNGIAIRRGLETVTTELGLLHGAARVESANTYHADGRSTAPGSVHLSTRA